MSEQSQASPSLSIAFKRDEDFESLYANHLAAEHSVWDLKVIFGILDQSVQPNQVVQHTSINLPWTQVKLAVYYLEAAIALQEFNNGKIVIPPSVLPPDPATIDTPEANAIPQALRDQIAQLWQKFRSTA
jgi:hypothetical protein